MPTERQSRPLPRHVAVIGAAGGLGQGILSVCREEAIGFTAIVRSRPERITDVPPGSRVAVVSSLADRYALTVALAGADSVLTALGVTSTSRDRSALLSENMETVEQAMLTAGVDRIVVTNTLLTSVTGPVCDPPHALLFVDARHHWPWGDRATSGGGCTWSRCVFVASMDPRPGRAERSGKRRPSSGLGGLGRCAQLVDAGVVSSDGPVDA